MCISVRATSTEFLFGVTKLFCSSHQVRVEVNCEKIVRLDFIFILTEPEQILDGIRNYCVSVDCIAERCYGYFSGL